MNSKLVSRKRWIGLLILALFLTLIANTPRATAAPAGNIVLQATPTPITQPAQVTQADASPEYGMRSVFMVVLLLGVLGSLFYLMFVWAQRLDQASYLGTLYRTTIQDIEFKRL